MCDSELSDFNDEDDLVRQYENNQRKNDDNIVQENNEDDTDLNEVKNEDETVQNKDSVVTKKRVSRKLYVLNTERLKGCKGIHTIEKLYEGFKFNGKGSEVEDLNRVMKRLEYWAFRLFPKLDFDDFLDKCEHLGHKKDLHTHLKKYRLGMIDADQICTQNEIIQDENDDQVSKKSKIELVTKTVDDNFQKLFDEINY
ncbi:PREDICTED: TIMELESS-interacting protein [Ceratosolen solmsi marchali]|uniref:TIMELESS-interacting protein n=1 Tax=Ceratosolen solmsi marchali TaxID=326594 RepID=A0AAJ7DXI4_9HYME|nr:PREDICTED: TIMELESS-interacting protein [Ceratosolen solmsi marchali]